MTPADIALARRAVAAPGWRWMAGMRAMWPDGAGERVTQWSADSKHDGALPDLTDPATLGCLLALVRERWGGFVWIARYFVDCAFRFHVHGLHRSDLRRVNGADGYASEAEALIAALEAPHV